MCNLWNCRAVMEVYLAMLIIKISSYKKYQYKFSVVLIHLFKIFFFQIRFRKETYQSIYPDKEELAQYLGSVRPSLSLVALYSLCMLHLHYILCTFQ